MPSIFSPGLFEGHVAMQLDLDQTITSGNKFYDPGDAVTRGNDDPWPIYADCKSTERASMILRVKDLRNYALQAASLGKHFIMPLRFWTRDSPLRHDYTLMDFYDFKELLGLARAALGIKRLVQAYRDYDAEVGRDTGPGAQIYKDIDTLLGMDP